MELTGWHKSTYSGSQSECVEVGYGPGIVGVRDTKDRDGGTLVMSTANFAALIDAVKCSGLDPEPIKSK